MSLKKCFQCNKLTYVPYQVTEISKSKEINTYSLCKICGDSLLKMTPEPEQKIDLELIKTPEQLLTVICGVKQLKVPSDTKPCPDCGLTVEEFDVKGKFGCKSCYYHFSEKMIDLVYPYHQGYEHVGKMPKKYWSNKCNSSIEEKTKLLKLKLAKAIELEEYEKAAEINLELRQVKPTSSEDQ